jgi:hypothetical protein
MLVLFTNINLYPYQISRSEGLVDLKYTTTLNLIVYKECFLLITTKIIKQI